MEERLRSARENLARLGQGIGAEELRTRIKTLEEEMGRPEFWADRASAQAKAKELEDARERLRSYENLVRELEDIETLWALAEEEDDEAARGEAQERLAEWERKFARARVEFLLVGPYDPNDCFLSINAGAGGTDAMDWAEMLLRMYSRFCEKAGFETRVVDETPGEEAGIKSATMEVRGRYAYGILKGETGVHRLVRISPFDAAHRRHTSFAAVTVTPIVPESDVELNEEDLLIETFRSSGPGGQHMQKNETAVRITHIPTGIVVTCQNERSQYQNKMTALKILRAKLRALMEQERVKKIEELRGELKEIEWGNQIRSYVLQPYQLVKDHRTEVEVGNVQAVLDGELWPFIWAYLESGRKAKA